MIKGLTVCVILACCACVGCGAASGTTPSEEMLPTTSSDPAKEKIDVAADDKTTANVKSTEPIEVTWDDLNASMQQDIVFRPQMLTERIQELDGQRIRITGVMMPDGKLTGIQEFILLKNINCKFGPGGQADHLIQIKLKDGVTASYKGDQPVEAIGTLKFNPTNGLDGNTWSIYDMVGEAVGKPRR